MQVASYADLEPFITKDGSEIRELAGPAWTAARAQSLAEATLPAGAATTAHYHVVTEEIYYLTQGSGVLRLGDEERELQAGDCVVIAPGVEHKLTNTGDVPIKLMCCCAPAYSHEDTVLTEAEP
jgi:mannose-6-phosphate isomerase-like protein (cupin superfamily)